MNTLLSSILIGISNFPFFATIFTLPILLIQFLHYRKINYMRIVLNYALVLYISCLLALVFFPLPDPSVAATLHSHYIQLIPFHFITDIIKESTFVWNNPSTYITSLFDDAILQYVFNICMTIPFGMFLRYYFNLDQKHIILCVFALSLFIEVGQLTGLFFIYKGSYRFCDVDDLIANTLGGYFGCKIMIIFQRWMPSIESFDFGKIHSLLWTKRNSLHF